MLLESPCSLSLRELSCKSFSSLVKGGGLYCILPTTTSVSHFDSSVVFLHQRGKQKWVKIKLPENSKGKTVFPKQHIKNLL